MRRRMMSMRLGASSGRRTALASIAIGVVACASTSSAADFAGGAPPAVAPDAALAGPILESRGCYFYRGRRRCGRYCYVEVNGKRYCREREREAYPQGPIGLFEWLPGDGLK